MNNNTLFFGQNLIKLEICLSTNNYLKELLANTKPMPEGTAILAVEQTQGKGQGGNAWFSDKGKNLSISYLLYPHFMDINRQFSLNIAISLGILDTCKHYLGANCKIKWPNDIYYQNKKIAGLLIENSAIGSQIRQTIVGIGLNVNQEKFPTDLPNASSFLMIKGKEFKSMEVFEELCKNLEGRYLQLINKKIVDQKSEYENNLFWKSEIKKFSAQDTIFEGEILGVTDEGLLKIIVNQKEELFDFKEIKFYI